MQEFRIWTFLDIENAVINGDVDAGVLIHESILTYSSLLEVERDLGYLGRTL